MKNFTNQPIHQLVCRLTIRSFFVFILFMSFQTNAQIDLSFEYTRTIQTWTVPQGIAEIEVKVSGAQGGDGYNTIGGYGGRAEGKLYVTPGQVLYIFVGGQGGIDSTESNSGGGWNGGGNASGTAEFFRGAGGGASDIRMGGTGLAKRVIIAGGGGGGGTFGGPAGWGGGLEGTGGDNSVGDGGSQSTGGASDNVLCESGSWGFGGSALPNGICSGGGGGYFGGAAGTGGGGGSGYIDDVEEGVFPTGFRTGHGLVRILYSPNSNDLCSDPLPLECNELISGNTNTAGVDNPPACNNAAGTGGGLWYSFIGQGEEVTVTTDHNGTNFNTQLSVFTGSCDELICVGQDDGPNDFASVTFFAADGGFYRVLVNGPNGSTGAFELSVICGPPCEDARSIGCSEVVIGTLANEIAGVAPTCDGATNSELGKWFTFVGDGRCMRMATCGTHAGNTTNFDTQISVFENDCSNLECIAYSDDDGDCAGVGGSEVFFATEVGVEYYILLQGKNNNGGQYTLFRHCIDPPPVEVTCPPNVTVSCYQPAPDGTNFAEEFEDMGGTISGGSCVESDYAIYYADEVKSCINSDTFVYREYTVINQETGLQDVCYQTIFCAIPNPLQVVCPPDTVVPCDGDIPAPAIHMFDFMNQGGIISGGSCAPFTGYIGMHYFVWSKDSILSSDCDGLQIERTYTVHFDGTGETVYCSQMIAKDPSPLPVLSCSQPIVVECIEDVIGPAGDNTAENLTIVAPPGCSVPFDIDIHNPIDLDGPSCNGDQYDVVITLMDTCGRTTSCTVSVTVENGGTFTSLSPDMVVECPDEIDAAITDLKIAPVCGFDPEPQFSGPEITGEGCNNLTYTYFYTFIDECGEEVILERVFTVENGGFQITCPVDQSVECAEEIEINLDLVEVMAPCGYSYSLEAIGPLLVEGNANCNGAVYTVTYTSEIDCGEIVSCTQFWTIENNPIQLVKSDPELMDVENGDLVQIQCYAEENNWTLPSFDETAFEAVVSCAYDYTIVYQLNDMGAVDCQLEGYQHRYEHVWIATDVCGSVDQFSFIVEVIDTIAPVLIGIPEDQTIDCASPIPLMPEVSATDECLCANIIFNEEVIAGNDCGQNRTILRTWTVSDHCGNETSATQRIFIEDSTAPVLTFQMPNQTVVENGEILSAKCGEFDYPDWIFEMDASSIRVDDACSTETDNRFTLVTTESNFCEQTGYIEKHELSWLVADECGNTSSFSFSIEIYDETAPVIDATETMYICGDQSAGYAFAYDECSDARMWYEDIPMEECGEGVVKRIYYSVDQCQNESTEEQIVVDLSLNPTLISLNEDVDISNLRFECSENKSRFADFGEYDVQPVLQCLTDLEIQFEERLLSNTCENGGSKLELIWTATTPCGYVDSIVIVADIVDTASPYFVDLNEIVELSCSDPMPKVIAIDDCGTVEIDIESREEPGSCSNERTIYRTITAVDICGNTATAEQTIHVIDNEGPSFNQPNSICENELSGTMFAVDQCTSKEIEATLISEENIGNCAEYEIIERVYSARDACGNESQFIQKSYPSDYTLEYQILNSDLSLLINEGMPIHASDQKRMDMMNQIDEISVVAIDPCGEMVFGSFDQTIEYHDECIDGIFETISLSWHFAEICGETFEFVTSFEMNYDLAPAIDLAPDTSIYCTMELPAMIIYNQDENMDYSIEINDMRDDNGDGLVERMVVATDACGNSNMAIQRIHAHNTTDLHTEIVGERTPPCNSKNNVYQAEVSGGTAPYTYEWIVKGGNCTIAVTYGNAAEINIGFGEAVVYVVVTDANGCITKSQTTISCEGLGHVESSFVQANRHVSNNGIGNIGHAPHGIFDLAVFPNPFTNNFNVVFNNKLSEKASVTVVNNLGVTVYQVDNVRHRMTFDMSNLSIGMYYLVVEDRGEFETIKLIKQDD